MTVSCEDESFLRLLSLTAQSMRSYADQRLKKYELTVEQLQVLKCMQFDLGQSQRQLCTAAGKSPANITRILDRMERKGRIVRRKNPNDRRASLVFLTEAGVVLRDQMTTLFAALGKELVEDIESERQKIAFDVLTIIKNKIESIPISQGE